CRWGRPSRTGSRTGSGVSDTAARPPAAPWRSRAASRRRAASGASVLLHERERPRAHLLGGATEWIPLLHAPPHGLPRLLGLTPQGREIDAGNHAIPHADHAVDDHGDHVVTDAAFHERLDGIAHGAEAQRVAR